MRRIPCRGPRRRISLGLASVLALVALLAIGFLGYPGGPDPQRAAGAMTVNNRTSAAFEQPAEGLSAAERNRHAEADLLFDRSHVPLAGGPGAGLGPQFIAQSCIACHVRNGRGRATTDESLVRVALREGGGFEPVPGLGHQVQNRAVLGAEPEADVTIRWQGVRLRTPLVALQGSEGELAPVQVARSLRVPPPLLGLGLLEAVPEATIAAMADPDDADGDGISGRAHWLPERHGGRRLGRFGWKAITASVRDQSAAAYREDMGLTTPVDRTREVAGDGRVADISNRELDLVTFYSQTLGAPRTAQPGSSALVRRGQHLFEQLRCARCHVPHLQTARGPAAVAEAIHAQTIWPYTDLLLHDMGPGLDDGVAERGARSGEWRTAPLWGIGLTRRVNAQATYLHDGRARTLEEAILWHGGEAQASREAYLALRPASRRLLLRWLNQL